MSPLRAFTLALVGGAFLAAVLPAGAEDVPHERYRGYRSERTAEEDRQTYELEQSYRDIARGRRLSLDGTYYGWQLCYMQAGNGWISREECDASVKDARRLKLWKDVDAARFRLPAVETYPAGDSEN
jgi:hypothetical protein